MRKRRRTFPGPAARCSHPQHGCARGRLLRAVLCWIAAWAVALAGGAAAAQVASAPVLVLKVEGTIGVATQEYIQRGLDRARATGAPLVVLQLDTPGGLVSSTRVIIRAMLASPVPIAVYVAPSGARAASAGTYMMYAAHVAAMARGTHLGAATPISLNSPMPGGTERDRKKDDDKKDDAKKDDEKDSGTAAERKLVNDAAAYLRALAQLRGRNAEWAERAVRTAATLTAEEAVKDKVVDLLAQDVPDLLAKVDGRTVTLASGEKTLATKGARTEEFGADWRLRILAVIGDPNIAYLLLLIGFYGIIFEFWSPGSVGPGVVGAISLLLGLGALTVLPVDYTGLALLALGVGLMTAEAFTPGIGVLGLGGVVAFVVGSLLLFDPDAARGIDFGVAWPVVAAMTMVSAAFFLFALGLALRSRRRPVVSGRESIVGSRGVVIEWSGGAGTVRVQGEVWSARGPAALAKGDAVAVRAITGLKLAVEPLGERRT
jgi:membrane-bound serine protease (ClpP class)